MSSKFIKEVQVITVSGKSLPRSKCRLINKKFYEIGNPTKKNSGDVYNIVRLSDNIARWYRVETGYLIYDHRVKMYMLAADLKVIVEDGIVGFEKDDTPIFGSFSQDSEFPSMTEVMYKGKLYICLDEELVKNTTLFMEAISDGVYYERQSIPAIKFVEPVFCTKEYKNSLAYDSKGTTKKYSNIFEKRYNPQYNATVEKFSDVLEDLTFGVEFETTRGKLSDNLLNRLGLIPLRDGSIPGLEFVTIPHSGKKGMQALIDSIQQLKKRTRYDNDCSLHIHIGNIPRTEKFFIALYKVLFRIQEDMYDIFPYHKFKNFGIKRKHYTKPLPLSLFCKLDTKIETDKEAVENFNQIFKFLSMGINYQKYGNNLNNITTHPSDPHGAQKWNIRTRYYWVNLIPLLFGNKQTVEFRIHTPTYDVNKIMNYLVLCASIINFTKKNQDIILRSNTLLSNLSINELIMHTFNKKGDDHQTLVGELINYFDYRREYINKCTSTGDFLAKEDEFYYQPRFMDWAANNNLKSVKKPMRFKKSNMGFLEHAIQQVQQVQFGQVQPPDELNDMDMEIGVQINEQ